MSVVWQRIHEVLGSCPCTKKDIHHCLFYTRILAGLARTNTLTEYLSATVHCRRTRREVEGSSNSSIIIAWETYSIQNHRRLIQKQIRESDCEWTHDDFWPQHIAKFEARRIGQNSPPKYLSFHWLGNQAGNIICRQTLKRIFYWWEFFKQEIQLCKSYRKKYYAIRQEFWLNISSWKNRSCEILSRRKILCWYANYKMESKKC